MSIASEQAAEAQKTDSSTNYYNIQAGPIYLRFQGEMGIETNDNANYSSTAPDLDIAFRPTANIKSFWPVTETEHPGPFHRHRVCGIPSGFDPEPPEHHV